MAVIESFCKLLTIQVGIAVLSASMFLVSALVFSVNIFDIRCTDDEDIIKFGAIAIMLVFVIMLIAAGVVMFLSAFYESSKLSYASIILLCILLVFWVVLVGLAFGGQPCACIRSRCAESLWMASLRSKHSYCEGGVEPATSTDSPGSTTQHVTHYSTPPESTLSGPTSSHSSLPSSPSSSNVTSSTEPPSPTGSSANSTTDSSSGHPNTTLAESTPSNSSATPSESPESSTAPSKRKKRSASGCLPSITENQPIAQSNIISNLPKNTELQNHIRCITRFKRQGKYGDHGNGETEIEEEGDDDNKEGFGDDDKRNDEGKNSVENNVDRDSYQLAGAIIYTVINFSFFFLLIIIMWSYVRELKFMKIYGEPYYVPGRLYN